MCASLIFVVIFVILAYLRGKKIRVLFFDSKNMVTLRGAWPKWPNGKYTTAIFVFN